MTVRTRWLYKKCTKCHGDMRLEEDIYGIDYKCLQCGYTIPVEIKEVSEEEIEEYYASTQYVRTGRAWI